MTASAGNEHYVGFLQPAGLFIPQTGRLHVLFVLWRPLPVFDVRGPGEKADKVPGLFETPRLGILRKESRYTSSGFMTMEMVLLSPSR
jgi:hypothetical protein